jgi:hypothetical protein
MEEELKNEENVFVKTQELVQDLKEEEKASTLKTLSSPLDILKKSFAFYKQNIKKILGLFFLPVLFGILLFVVGLPLFVGVFVSGFNWSSLLLGLFFVFLLLIFYFLYLSSVVQLSLFNLFNSENPKELKAWSLFKDTYKKTGNFFWASLVLGFVLMVGFALFIIPGLFLLTFYVFTSFIVYEDKLSIKQAMKKSREYIRGIEWKFASRLFFAIALLYVLNYVLSRFLSPISGLISHFFLVPVFCIYIFSLYQEVKRIKVNI